MNNFIIFFLKTSKDKKIKNKKNKSIVMSNTFSFCFGLKRKTLYLSNSQKLEDKFLIMNSLHVFYNYGPYRA